jgi:hypothetical protein
LIDVLYNVARIRTTHVDGVRIWTTDLEEAEIGNTRGRI